MQEWLSDFALLFRFTCLQRHRLCSFVRASGTHILKFSTSPIAGKCQEIACDDAESSAPSCRMIDVHGTLIVYHKWFTSHHTGLLAPVLWSISILSLRNLANNLRTVHALVVSTPHVLLTLAVVAASECQKRNSC
ncbi:hypothetical protein TNCT_94711 [Trichonephila clavata]|uniref:Uncharacterized protein n=1 Tax=Trichonephila clavata TaxID=2740835 RepID=A0A8X6ISP9_TRICU|nr:hypothetical protein TNCT_94711 [Trichonephila clavata]